MDIILMLTVAVLVGWLATLIMDTDNDVSLVDFSVGVFGAGLGGGLLAPALGISASGEFGLTLLGTLFCWVAATILLAAVNLMRCGTLRRDPRSRRPSGHVPLLGDTLATPCKTCDSAVAFGAATARHR